MSNVPVRLLRGVRNDRGARSRPRRGTALSPVATCPFANPSSVATTTLALLAIGQLQNNGGPTFTHALLAGSNAIGAVATASCNGVNSVPVTVDQRGVSRVTDGFCDVGAFEYDFTRIFANGFDPP